MVFEHIFFDLDHTLWDFNTNAALAYKRCFDEMKIDMPVERFLPVYRLVNERYWELYRNGEVTKEQLKYGRLKDSFDLLEYSISEEKILVLADLFLKYLPMFNHLFDGAREVLDYASRKYRLHIITNGFDEVQLPKLENADIARYFDTVVTAEQAGARKPDSDIFVRAFQQSKAIPHYSLMIGDSYEADILGAIQVGMSAVLFDPENKSIGKHAPRIIELRELFDII